MSVSMFGPRAERHKTCLWLPKVPFETARDLAEWMDLPLNAMHTLALCQWVASVAPLIPGKKTKRRVLDAVEVAFNEVLAAARGERDGLEG